MLKLIKTLFGAASLQPNSANAPYSPERRLAAGGGVAHVPERRVAVMPELFIDKPPEPDVDEGNSDADWDRWQESVIALEGKDPSDETATMPSLPYERRKEPRHVDGGLDSVRLRD